MNKNKSPEFRFIAIFNRWGVALASNIPGSILHISQNPAVALISDPSSGLKWEKVAKEFKSTIFSDPPTTLDETMIKFNDLVNKKENSHKLLGIKKEEILFVGFDRNEIYPSMLNSVVSIDSEGKIIFEKIREEHLKTNLRAFIHLMGSFNYILPLIYGISGNFEHALKKQIKNRISKFEENLKNKSIIKDSDSKPDGSQEEFLTEEIAKFIKVSKQKTYDDVLIGLDSFSMQDMGDAINHLINAESRFSNLKHPGKGCAVNFVCERAVMTIPEGFTWIERVNKNQP